LAKSLKKKAVRGLLANNKNKNKEFWFSIISFWNLKKLLLDFSIVSFRSLKNYFP